MLQTVAIIATVVVASWIIGGQVQAVGGQVQANSEAISDLRDDMHEMRSLLVSHNGHSHSANIVGESENE